MPTFKHPCPYCAKFIEGDSVACPFCGVTEPFTHGRCPDCRASLQPGWIACPKCGRTLTSADGIGNGPFFSTVNPSHNKLFISNSRETDGTVSVINLRTQSLLAPITNIGSQPFDLTFK